ncbi:MAG: glycosyltransferase family 2 protein [Patescibacteria group bacterium]
MGGIKRLWEIIPGLATWVTILGLLTLSFVSPRFVATFVLLFAIYWVVRIIIMTNYLLAGYRRYRREQKVDWLVRLKAEFPARWEDLYHLAIVPTYKEDISILRHTLGAIKDSNYLSKKLIVVIAFEERETELAPEYAKTLRHEFEHSFGGLLTTFHPGDIPGEVRGKGPNITWSARRALEYIDDKKINCDDVIVTTLDADNRVDKNYFGNVSWAFLNDPDPHHKSFQPLPMFFNNIWQVPLAVKMTAMGSSFWQMIQAMRPHYARNFSAHSQSLRALVETDFWSVETIVEDGHQYWRSYFVFNGNHHIVPIFVPVYMDAVQGENMYQTFREQYLQRRRWFWGVSDVPYVFARSFGNGSIPFFYKWLQFGRLFESHWSLATQSFILLIGWLPAVLNVSFQNSVLGYNFPIVYRAFLLAAWIGMITTMAIASMIVPPRPGSRAIYALTVVKEWILAPILLSVTAVLFSALPAIDSQTRMLFNKPLNVFNVTKKIAVPNGIIRVED